MKKVILLYDSRNRNEKLNDMVKLLTHTLNEAGIDCTIETCAIFNAKAQLEEEYDMVAGYHIDTDVELSFCQKFVNKYLHFFDSHHCFSFANVTKREEMAGYKTYTISPISVN